MHASLKDTLLALPFYALPHHGISWCMYKLARIRWQPLKNLIIRTYTALHTVKMEEAVVEDKYAYEHLNAFFTRELKSECRPFHDEENSWLCPVDGSVSQAKAIKQGRIFQAKGQDYSLLELLGGDEVMASVFKNGQFATLYLSPRDYHRIHMPVKGNLTHMAYIPGRLFSVASHTVNVIPRLFARNERCACYFDTEHGPMAMILVGAINVSAIETVWHDGRITTTGSKIKHIAYKDGEVILERGQEMGRFNLGSTVIVIGTNKLEWDALIQAGNEIKLGQCLARSQDQS